jgi:hypothetical protein
MKERIEELANLCIEHTLPITISRTEGNETKVISFLPYALLSSKTARMIVEGKIINKDTYKLIPDSIYLA